MSIITPGTIGAGRGILSAVCNGMFRYGLFARGALLAVLVLSRAAHMWMNEMMSLDRDCSNLYY